MITVNEDVKIKIVPTFDPNIHIVYSFEGNNSTGKPQFKGTIEACRTFLEIAKEHNYKF